MICELCRTPNAHGDRCGLECPMHHNIIEACFAPKHPTVHTHAAEIARLFVGCINELLANVGVADRLDPEGLPADLVAFVERVRNDALDEAAAKLLELSAINWPKRKAASASYANAHASVLALKLTP